MVPSLVANFDLKNICLYNCYSYDLYVHLHLSCIYIICSIVVPS